MAGLTSEAPTPNDMLCESSGPCNRKSEPVKGSVNTSHLNPYFINKRALMRNSKETRPHVFKGREAALNYAIFFVLSQNSPLAVWNILTHVRGLPHFKHTKYAVICLRVKALETQGYLRRAGTRDKKQGGQTNLYEPTIRANLATAFIGKTMDNIINQLDDETALAVLKTICR